MSQVHRTDGHEDRPEFLQHHFDTPLQQFDSGKLGMWLFIATEILLFGGLFVAYAVYRANHPEVFEYAHVFLDYRLGALNTVILLCSSLTMAWGVRAAQLGQRRLLLALLSLTLVGGLGFMTIKFVEYRAKFEHGTLWASRYESQLGRGHGATADHGADAGHAAGDPAAAAGAQPDIAAPAAGARAAAGTGSAAAAGADEAPAGFRPERSVLPAPASPPAGPAGAGGVGRLGELREPDKVGIFWSIYFLMTGLHGAHVLIGMLAIGWIMFRANRGDFGPRYFTPVDLVGLYWHLVDLIWIFLFPLLYLIK